MALPGSSVCVRSDLLAKLTLKQRRYIAMMSFGLSQKAIAEICGVTVGAVHHMINLSRSKIGAIIGEEYDGSTYGVPVWYGITEPMLSKNLFLAALPGLPPSLNSAYPNSRNGAGRYLSKEGKEWKAAVVPVIEQAKTALRKKGYNYPMTENTGIMIYLHIPLKLDKDGAVKTPNWDGDNRKKMVLDILTECEVWQDDRWTDTSTIKRVYDLGLDQPLTEVIAWECADAGLYSQAS